MKAAYQDFPTAAAITVASGKGYDSIGGGAPPPPQQPSSTTSEEPWERGETQDPEYRDVWFGIIFWIQLSVLVGLAVLYIVGIIPVHLPDLVDDDDLAAAAGRFLLVGEDNEDEGYEGAGPNGSAFAFAAVSTLVVAPGLTVLVFGFLARNASSLIRLSLYTSIGTNVLLAVLCLLTGVLPAAFFFIFVAIVTMWYAKIIWRRIPYAAANLKTAVTSIRSQLGVAFLGLASVPVVVVFWILWIFTFTMTLSTDFMQSQTTTTTVTQSDGTTEEVEVYTGVYYLVVVTFLLSLFWSLQVMTNIVQTTVAGSVGTWWFVPEEAIGCCSPALTSSFERSMTYSFGSICLGSLLVALIQTLKAIAEQTEQQSRQNNDGGGALLACLARCLLSCLEDLVEYFNKWAFVYVGLYGYSYVEAGKKVFDLFQNRGWTAIISDQLIGRVLGIMSLAIGIVTAVISAGIAAVFSSGEHDSVIASTVILSMVVAWILGIILSSIIFGVVNGGVNTVIVLYAEAPNEFQETHPGLSREMNEAYYSAWPDIFSPGTGTTTVPLTTAAVVY